MLRWNFSSVSRVLSIAAAFFYETRVGLAFSYLCTPEGKIHSKGWARGKDVESKRGCRLVSLEGFSVAGGYFSLRRFNEGVTGSVSEGAIGVRCVAVSRLVETLDLLAGLLERALIVSGMDGEDCVRQKCDRIGDPSSLQASGILPNRTAKTSRASEEDYLAVTDGEPIRRLSPFPLSRHSMCGRHRRDERVALVLLAFSFAFSKLGGRFGLSFAFSKKGSYEASFL